MKKLKVTRVEIDGKEHKAEEFTTLNLKFIGNPTREETMEDISNARGGYGKPVEFSKPGEKASMELERLILEKNKSFKESELG